LISIQDVFAASNDNDLSSIYVRISPLPLRKMQPVSAIYPRETGTDGSGAAGADRSWHAASIDEVLKFYETSLNGLRESEAAERRRRYGSNKLPEAKSRRAIVRFLLQFNNVLILVLLAASLITALLGHWIDTGVILLVVLVNAVIGFVQEGKAERALDAIRKMISPQASVVREGHRSRWRRKSSCPATSSFSMPAIACRPTCVSPAFAISESTRRCSPASRSPVDKNAEAVAADAPVGDRSSMAFSGTLVVSGHGTGIVVGTGTNTELGRISEMLGSIETLTTPLLRKMNQFARQLAVAILLLSALLFVFALLVRAYPIVDAFMAAVALAVAAIPEGLPAVMTITLAIGVQRMAARNAIIRRLPAVETLGSVSIICADKTGTFTRNEMTVRSVIIAGTSLSW
jgi:magnesium-transporting ATPase (P-type)